jgi:hypothetical protein
MVLLENTTQNTTRAWRVWRAWHATHARDTVPSDARRRPEGRSFLYLKTAPVEQHPATMVCSRPSLKSLMT